MSERRNLATPISITVAVVCAAWAIYATQHRAPAGGGGPPGGGGGRSNVPTAVTTATVRSERLSQKLEALGNARANESVDISSKTSNVVTAVRFRDGERVRAGQVLVQLDDATARAVLNSWGPGKFDAELLLDGKAFRPDGRSAATLIPPEFGIAGVNLKTWTGWGSVKHWNEMVANLEMNG